MTIRHVYIFIWGLDSSTVVRISNPWVLIPSWCFQKHLSFAYPNRHTVGTPRNSFYELRSLFGADFKFSIGNIFARNFFRRSWRIGSALGVSCRIHRLDFLDTVHAWYHSFRPIRVPSTLHKKLACLKQTIPFWFFHVFYMIRFLSICAKNFGSPFSQYFMLLHLVQKH